MWALLALTVWAVGARGQLFSFRSPLGGMYASASPPSHAPLCLTVWSVCSGECYIRQQTYGIAWYDVLPSGAPHLPLTGVFVVAR